MAVLRRHLQRYADCGCRYFGICVRRNAIRISSCYTFTLLFTFTPVSQHKRNVRWNYD